MKRLLSIGIILLFIGMSMSSSTGFNIEKKSISSLDGDIFYVDDDFNESTPGWNVTHFARIQDAYKVVSDGDTIFVYSGKYTGNIRINKSINLIGEDWNTTYVTSTVSIVTNWVNISGFTIKTTGPDIKAIFCDSKYNTIKNNNVFSNNSEAIDIGDNHNTIDSNIITGSRGIYIVAERNIISNNTIFVRNTAISIMGVFGKNTIIDNIIQGSSRGCAFDLWYCDYNNISHNIISNFEDGFYIWQGDHNTIAHNIISSNKRDGIENVGGDFNNFIRNHIIDNKEGIYIHGIGNVIKNNNFINNSKRNAYFSWAALNRWNGNYWDESRNYPYPIFGNLGILSSISIAILAICPFVGGRIIAAAFLLLSLYISEFIPNWINWDLNPAQKPYDIGG